MKYSVVLPNANRFVETAAAPGSRKLAWWDDLKTARFVARLYKGKVVRTERFLALTKLGVPMKTAARHARLRRCKVEWRFSMGRYRGQVACVTWELR